MGERTRGDDELAPEDGIAEWSKREWKDPSTAKRLRRFSAVATPCEAAWRSPAYRDAIRAWLAAAPLTPRTLILAVMMPQRLRRDAVFERRLRIWHPPAGGPGVRLYVAVDTISGAVFAARRLGP